MAFSPDVGAEGILAGAGLLSRPAEEFENDPSLEWMWARKAYEHAEIYFNILCSVDPQILRLTPNDDEIYYSFRKDFPKLRVDVIKEDDIKSPTEKQKWREFCDKFKMKVEDHSFGTLLRLDCMEDYSEANSTLVPRIQFYAIELARNREGHNNCIREKFSQNKKNSGSDIDKKG